MQRLRHFALNAGLVGIVQTVAVFALMGIFLKGMPGWSDRWPYLILIVAGFLVGFCVRNPMVDQIESVGPALQFFAYLIVGASLLYVRGMLPPIPNMNFILTGATATYMGCYIWLFSDPRIFTQARLAALQQPKDEIIGAEPEVFDR